MTDRAATWCSECMSDSHDYPDCPKGDGAPPTDLSAQIRATLDAWAKPAAIIETPRALSPEEYAKFVQAWKDARTGPETHRLKVIEPGAPVEPDPVPFDRMRDALLAVLDATDPEEYGADWQPCGCLTCAHERVLLAIAGKLGTETADD